MINHWVLWSALVLLLPGRAATSGPLPFELQLHVPPIIDDSKAPTKCTIAYMVADLGNNDLFAVRMRVEAAETDIPVQNRLPCPIMMPPRVGLRALDVCTTRTGEAKNCVFADMSRGFDREAGINNTSENASRCASDEATAIGAACWMSGALAVCNVACGNSPEEALGHARVRCEEKQQHRCLITATVPVSGP